MPKCFACKAELGGGGIAQENGTVLCGPCDARESRTKGPL